ncbi:transposase (DDE domain) [Legionella geestiana]|uniref:Transposase (DDE domain) n=3 Tax=Legionella geestiana TaxID=45065 RepID=A0A0W0TY49_9GAMM|nr:IS982 family transposase [Legionella geestiana]KTD00399.1 transposase (DDE domain) [Legionella geestiana]QBS11542.1 IS982 family transposase [Legionella geestiana]QBS12492.1 IS982 family transposase [Legionella geestiana]QBS12673.1 IS982 family transposase [Legionella geestiana]QBS12882.1 IS982 family transposase [Legionella geestiana]
MPVEDFIISTFCLIDSLYKKAVITKLRTRGFAPRLSDPEVITIELVGEFLGLDTDKAIWSYFKRHWQNWFPGLGDRTSFARQSAKLWAVKQSIQKLLAGKLGTFNDSLHMSDGFPLPICHFRRANFSRLFSEAAAYGYCASKNERYYGFKGNLLIDSQGVITAITVTQANIDERESVWDNLDNVQGMIIADKGLIGQDFQEQIRQHTNVTLQTPLRSNMTDPRGSDFSKWLVSTRRLVETVIGQLTERFHIQKVRARDLWHLTSRIGRKTLAHTIGCFLNHKRGAKLTQFDGLVAPL